MEHKFDNIYLIGPMGCGKSTTGRSLAHLTKYVFHDIDQLVVDTAGVEISWIFEREGEAGFRRREKEALTKLSTLKHCIISTGGGCILSAANREILKTTGVAVYLKVSIDVQLDRISHKKNTRPLFASKEQLQQLNQSREPLYQEVADLTVDTDAFNPQELATIIFADYKKLKGAQK